MAKPTTPRRLRAVPLRFVKDRAKTLGAVYELSSGRKVCMAFREDEHIFRGDPEPTPRLAT